MKVIEKLFHNYLLVPSDQYVNKYLAAKAILEIIEDGNPESPVLKKIKDLRDSVHYNCPISVFKAERFLRSSDTTLTITIDEKNYTFSKIRGHDYLISEYLGDFLDKLNAEVVKSLSSYNTDRGRNTDFDEEIPE